MSYKRKAGESPAQTIKRIALEQIDKALDDLSNEEDREEAVHSARKRFKKIRALLRLVRDEIGDDVYKAENRCFRDVGRALSDVRTSQVMINTLDNLLEQHADQLRTTGFDSIRQKLVAAHEATVQRVLDENNAITEVHQRITEARERVSTWPIEDESFDAFGPGLKRVYKRGRKRMAEAYADPSAERFHEWRKRVKYLWYHLRVLQTLWPGLLSPLAEEIHHLANLLGDDHDLAELKQELQQLPDVDPRSQEMEVLLGLIEQKRRQYQTDAQPLGQQIYTEEPSTFVDRVGSYWQIQTQG